MTKNRIHFHQSWYYCSCFVQSQHYKWQNNSFTFTQHMGSLRLLPQPDPHPLS